MRSPIAPPLAHSAMSIHRHVLGLLALSGVAAAWSGCAEEATPDGTTSSGTGGSVTGPGGAGGEGAGGAFNIGGAGSGGGAICASTSAKAEPTPLDIIFALDWSQSMQGESWEETTSALETFLQDPLSAGIGAGMVFFPTVKPFGSNCDTDLYKVLDVPIAPLPGNTFALMNAMPADATGNDTPLGAALPGTLMAATAYQDAHPTHKVILVLSSDGGFGGCGPTIDEIADWARSALEYNGVRTYVISVQSASNYPPENLEKIAAKGGTDIVYDATDISNFSAKIEEIRAAALGCDFEIPPVPSGMGLVPDEVNFTYTPGGSDTPITLPRADNLADCGDQPGWYFDSNVSPTKIIVCPASCATIQNDTEAEVAAAFGCASVPN